RHTNRNAYELQRAVPAAAWQAMAEAVAPYRLRFGHAGPDQPAVVATQRQVAAEAWRIELVTPRTVMESYRVLRVGAKEVATHRDGISLIDTKVVWL
ncbi:MAG TPA: twin-arginine translocation pathway signal protein, partial [Rubrivivax sp.]|nr:twin-arginine translocation pathway signal protein [Rubrivivax sp.]